MRLTGTLLLLLLTALAIGTFASGASAASAGRIDTAAAGATVPTKSLLSADDKIHVIGILKDTRTTPAKPVSGVKITVTDSQGTVVGQATSGADGKFSIPLPGTAIDALGKTYVVKIDTKSLPSGSKLRNAKQVSNEIHIQLQQDYSITFPIGPGPKTTSNFDQGLQSLINGSVFGLELALASLGLSLVFGTTGLTNFSHGELVTFGAIVAYAFDSRFGIPVIVCGVIATILSGGFGYLQDRALWRPLRKRGTGLVAMMIVSIGVGIFLRNLFQFLAGADSHQYSAYTTVQPWHLGPVDVTSKSLIVALVCVAVLLAVSLAVQRTRLGKATRAVADNPALASSSGINVDRVITLVWVIGAALAGLAGFLLGLTQGLDYQLGFKILLLVFAAVTLGGLGTIWGAMAGSLIIGLVIEESTLIIPAELKYVAALVVLIAVLLVRPQGLLGRRERVG
jgi:branched-subunit amino acid ABC-type transport system permease component